jgi:hypothetical protein
MLQFKSSLLINGGSALEKEIVFLVEESIDGGYEARALGHSIFTEGESLEEIKGAVKDAVHCHFGEEDLPKIIRLHFVKDEVIAV